MKDAESGECEKCFICDETVVGKHESLLNSSTKYSNVTVANKISSLVGENFLVVVEEKDVLCHRCIMLINQMDKLDEELRVVQNIISSHIFKKYNCITEEEELHCPQLNGLDTDSLFTCEICPYQTHELDDFEDHIQQHSEANVDISTLEHVRIKPEIVSRKRRAYFCTFCSAKFYTQKECSSHLHTAHGLSSPPSSVTLVCLKCRNLSDSTAPENFPQMDSESVLTCKVCGVQKCGDEAESVFGITMVSRLYVCHICGEQCSSETDMEEHCSLHAMSQDFTSNTSIDSSQTNDDPPSVKIDNSKKRNQETEPSFICDQLAHSNHPLTNRLETYDINIPVKVEILECEELREENVFLTQVEVQGEWLTCEICLLQFETESDLAQHIKTHTSNKCAVCGKAFPSELKFKEHRVVHTAKVQPSQCEFCLESIKEGSLLTHLRAEHSQIKTSLLCPLCNRRCASLFALKRHVIKCHLVERLQKEIRESYCEGSDLSNSEYQIWEEIQATEETALKTAEERSTCNTCNKSFKSKASLQKHLKTHSIEGEEIYCPSCQLIVSDEEQLKAHIESQHPDYNQYCDPCGMNFNQGDAFVKHKAVAHSNDKTCDICGKHFAVARKLMFHKEYCHREELKCVFCEKTFRDIKKLKLHEDIHKRNNGKTFECDTCDKTFKTASGLRFHKLSHTGNYPFFCEYCGRGFVSTHHLEEHVSKHTGEQRFVCDVCGKRFQLYDTYYRHRNLHDNPYPKQCDICKQNFRNASRVAEHKRKVHTGERPYKCSFCPMTFNISSTYKVHLCIHTQKFPHNCEACGRGFTTRIKYATHLASKHGDFSVLNDKKPNYKQVFPDNYFY